MRIDKFSALGYGKSSSNSRIATSFTEITAWLILSSFKGLVLNFYKKHGEGFTDSSEYYCEVRGH